MWTHFDEAGDPAMVDVSEKKPTKREAWAEGYVTLPRKIFEALSLEGGQAEKSGQNKKGDPFIVAELAGIQAAKSTPQIIPLCHNIRLDKIEVKARLYDENRVKITSHAIASDVTGVEMEALTAVSAAALAFYDMCKGVDKGMSIEGIRLLKKTGGKSGVWLAADYEEDKKEEKPHEHHDHHAKNAKNSAELTAAILTVSDKGSAGQRVDTAGPALAELVVPALGARVVAAQIVPDDKEKIAHALKQWADEDGINLILCTGGTGLSPRDVTPEALMSIADKVVPGIGEKMRSESAHFTDTAFLTRGIAVIRAKTLIIALPGSERGARQCFEAIKKGLRHGVETLIGAASECGS